RRLRGAGPGREAELPLRERERRRGRRVAEEPGVERAIGRRHVLERRGTPAARRGLQRRERGAVAQQTLQRGDQVLHRLDDDTRAALAEALGECAAIE